MNIPEQLGNNAEYAGAILIGISLGVVGTDIDTATYYDEQHDVVVHFDISDRNNWQQIGPEQSLNEYQKDCINYKKYQHDNNENENK